MATLFEYYNTGDDDVGSSAYGLNWVAQSFTPVTSHKITKVKLKLGRMGSPGTVTVSIRATSSGLPTGDDLCFGTTDGDTLIDFLVNPECGWREITLGAGYNLVAGTQYAICWRAPSGDASNKIRPRSDTTNPTYTRGTTLDSYDGGSSWEVYPDWREEEYMFEEWGDPVSPYHLNIKNVDLPYEDLDKTKEIHVLLKNLSPTAKNAGADGEVVIEVKYEPAA